jgi:predicted acetyltransferase
VRVAPTPEVSSVNRAGVETDSPDRLGTAGSAVPADPGRDLWRVVVLEDDVDLERAAELFRGSMVGLPPGAVIDDRLHEAGRPLGVFEDGHLVGTANSYSSFLVVPGGVRLAHGAVTHVGVSPSHRRRGIARSLILGQLEQLDGRGEIVATLRASQGSIYERFGYGIASHAHELEVDASRARLRPTLDPGGPVRLIESAGSQALLARIYESAGALWNGAIDRLDYWWRSVGLDDPSHAQYVAVHGPVRSEDGFVRYHPVDREEWFHSRTRTVVVDDFVALSTSAHVGLVRHLVGLDVVDRIIFAGVPVDDPLPQLFTDERVVSVRARHDETWLRLVDVAEALAARRFRSAHTVVLEVRDVHIPRNSGTYLVSAEGVARTDLPPDLMLDVSALATVYLGGSRFWQLHRAGRVSEHRRGALERADELFAVDQAPFSGVVF